MVTENGKPSLQAIRKLNFIGYDHLQGFLKGGIPRWQKEGFPIQTLKLVSPELLVESQTSHDFTDCRFDLLDVRSTEEFDKGHLKKA